MELKCLLSGETPTGSDSSETTLVREIKFWFLMISNLIWAWVRSTKKFKWNTEICEEKRFYFMCKVCGRKIWKNHPDSRPVLSSWIPNPHIVYLCICKKKHSLMHNGLSAPLTYWPRSDIVVWKHSDFWKSLRNCVCFDSFWNMDFRRAK